MYNSEEEKKAIHCIERNLKVNTYFEIEEVKKWITKRMNILNFPDTEVDNSGLMNIIKTETSFRSTS